MPSRRKPLVPSRLAEIEAGVEGPVVAEHHVSLAGILVAARRGMPRADDHVVEPVAVDVAGRRHRIAAQVEVVDAVEPEAVAAVERREVEIGRKAAVLAEHDVGRPGPGVGQECPDHDVVEAVAVDVAGRGHREAAVVADVDSIEAEAVGAVECIEIDDCRKIGHDCPRAAVSDGRAGTPAIMAARSIRDPPTGGAASRYSTKSLATRLWVPVSAMTKSARPSPLVSPST